MMMGVGNRREENKKWKGTGMRDWKQALHLRGHSPRGISHPAFGEQSGAEYMPFPISCICS